MSLKRAGFFRAGAAAYARATRGILYAGPALLIILFFCRPLLSLALSPARRMPDPIAGRIASLGTLALLAIALPSLGDPS